MNDYQGFWSYVQADDNADAGRIARLARDVGAQFEMQTGEAVAVFLDRDALQWGDDWRGEIDASLASIAFFVAVLTPRYFRSAECRRELQLFARRAKDLGVGELVLPLLYVDVPALHEDQPNDALVELVRTFQWEDWRDIRFAEVESEPYRRAVSRLAERLVDANRRAERAGPSAPVPSTGDEPEETGPGMLDLIAAAEEALPKWRDTLLGLGREIGDLGAAMKDATAQVQRADAQGKGFAARARIARVLALRLAAPANRIQMLGDDYTRQMHDVDGGVRSLITLSAASWHAEPEQRETICQLFGVLRVYDDAAAESLETVQGLVEAMLPLERMSRDLRPPLRKMRKSLTSMLEGREVSAEWMRMMDESSIECPDVDMVLDPELEGLHGEQNSSA